MTGERWPPSSPSCSPAGCCWGSCRSWWTSAASTSSGRSCRPAPTPPRSRWPRPAPPRPRPAGPTTDCSIWPSRTPTRTPVTGCPRCPASVDGRPRRSRRVAPGRQPHRLPRRRAAGRAVRRGARRRPELPDGSLVLPPIFAQTMAGNSGFDGASVGACARATWQTPAQTPILGLAISRCEWSDLTGGSAGIEDDPQPADERTIFDRAGSCDLFRHQPADGRVAPARSGGLARHRRVLRGPSAVEQGAAGGPRRGHGGVRGPAPHRCREPRDDLPPGLRREARRLPRRPELPHRSRSPRSCPPGSCWALAHRVTAPVLASTLNPPDPPCPVEHGGALCRPACSPTRSFPSPPLPVTPSSSSSAEPLPTLKARTTS